MRPPDAGRGYGVAAKWAPVVTTLAIAFLSAVPLAIPGYAVVAPNFILMSLYHWTLYRPEHLSYFAVFLIGLFFDLLTTAPGAVLGLTPLLLLLARWGVMANRRAFAGRSFPYVWAGFAILALSVDLASWGAQIILNGRLLELRAFVFQAVLTIALFPLATLVLARILRLTAAPA